MSYEIRVAGKKVTDAFDIHVKIGINKLRFANFSLPNPKGKFNWILKNFPFSVFLGDPLKNFFNGKIETKENMMEEGDFIILEGFGEGSILFDKLLTQEYENVNGKEIIKDAIALTDLSDACVDPDNEIATNFTREYERKPAWEVIEEVCKESAKANGVVGFYFFVDQNKVVHVYPYDKFTSNKVIKRGLNMSSLRRKELVCTVKNKIFQQGASKKKLPILGDEYTETLDINNDATNDWKSGTGTGVVSLVTTPKYIGSYAIQHDTQSSDYYGRLWLDLPSGYEIDANKNPSVNFALQIEKDFSGDVALILRNAGDFVVHWFTIGKEKFFFKSVRCGKKNKEHWEGWEGFDWSSIDEIYWDCLFSILGTGKFWLDNLFFDSKRFEAIVQDVQSQGEHGEKPWVAPIREELESDAECEIVAKEYLKRKKDPSKILEVGVKTICDEQQGKILYVQDSIVHKINEVGRILEVEHYLTDRLGTTFELSLEPLGFSPIMLATEERLRILNEGLKRKVA